MGNSIDLRDESMKFINLLWLIPFGFVIGSILNHLADTLPRIRRIPLNPQCIKCGQTFDIYNYIILSRCHHCSVLPSNRRYIVLLISVICFPIIYFFPPDFTGWIIAFIVFSYLGLVFIIDFEHRLILHPVSLIGAVLFLTIGIFLNGWKVTLLGALSGFGLMYILYLFGILFGKVMAKRRGQEIEEIALGFGDVTLSTILGLLLGWPRIGVVLFFAIIFGGVFSGLFLLISVLAKKYRAFTAIPYAPFIIISSIILIYFSTGK